jgi:hypothetical protein
MSRYGVEPAGKENVCSNKGPFELEAWEKKVIKASKAMKVMESYKNN